MSNLQSNQLGELSPNKQLNGVGEKECPECGETLPLTKFYQRKNGKYYPKCKKCNNADRYKNKRTPYKRGSIYYEFEVVYSPTIDGIVAWPLGCCLQRIDVAYCLQYGSFEIGMKLKSRKNGHIYTVMDMDDTQIIHHGEFQYRGLNGYLKRVRPQ